MKPSCVTSTLSTIALVNRLSPVLVRSTVGVAGAIAQFVDRVFVERLDLEHLVDRHVGDFLERGEAFADEDVGDLLVDVELVDEQAPQLVADDLARWQQIAETLQQGRHGFLSFSRSRRTTGCNLTSTCRGPPTRCSRR